MKKMMLIFMAGLMLISLTVYGQDDVSVDSYGNVKTGVTNTNANFEVTGASLEHAIVGGTSGTGAIGVIGRNSDSNYVGFLGTDGSGVQGENISNDNFGKLGTEFYGVYGHSTGTDNWAGFFHGNTRVTGDLTVDGAIYGPSIGDITGVTTGTGLTGGGTSGDVVIDADTNYLQRRVNTFCTAGSSIRAIDETGVVTCEQDDVGITVESDPLFSGSAAAGISAGDITNWNTAFGWGDHSTVGYDTTNDSWTGTGDVYMTSGNVGIGTTAPNDQLEITGNLRLPVTTATTGIIKSGTEPLIHTYGTDNFFAGINAGNLSMSGTGNTAIGSGALQNNSTANKNTAVGKKALFTQSFDNGGSAWDSNNTAVGFEALYSNEPISSSHGNNTAVGSLALRENTIGVSNTAIGASALNSNVTGFYNTATGHHALSFNTEGNDNTATGYIALYANIDGIRNTAIGSLALATNTTGSLNTAIGYTALGVSRGGGNTAIGVGALFSNALGNNNTAIGYNADVSSGNLYNATAIGNEATVNASDKVRIGNTSVSVIEGQVAFSWPSDIRIKKDIKDVGYGLEFIRQLRPVQYRLKEGNNRIDFGFIAQDIEELLGTNYNILGIGEDAERQLSLRYTDLIAPMVKAMQQQQAQIEQQQKLIAELKKLVCISHSDADVCR